MKTAALPQREHSVPWFWPLSAAIELGEAGLKLFAENVKYLSEVEKIEVELSPVWATPNRVMLDLDTLRLRDFSSDGPREGIAPVLIDAPYAGHSSTIADLGPGQSLVEALRANGLRRLLVTDWKSATDAMKEYDIDKYLGELNVAVDSLGGEVNLVGLCQGGWMSAMYAARFPRKVRSLVLAGAPIDTDAGDGVVRKMAHELPMSFYEELVALGGGRMLGKFMLAGWKSMHPSQQYFGKYLDLYTHIENRNFVARTEAFERWYENPINLPGRFYLQAIRELFKENRLAKGAFQGLGKTLNLRDVDCPVFLLAGAEDDITPREQVFAAERLVGTAKRNIAKSVAPGGHIGLFMGRRPLAESWPAIARWISANGVQRQSRSGP